MEIRGGPGGHCMNEGVVCLWRGFCPSAAQHRVLFANENRTTERSRNLVPCEICGQPLVALAWNELIRVGPDNVVSENYDSALLSAGFRKAVRLGVRPPHDVAADVRYDMLSPFGKKRARKASLQERYPRFGEDLELTVCMAGHMARPQQRARRGGGGDAESRQIPSCGAGCH